MSEDRKVATVESKVSNLRLTQSAQPSFSALIIFRLSKWIPNKQQHTQLIPYPLWCCGCTWARASSIMRFIDHTQRHSTLGRSVLDEWSACCTDLYLTTKNTHNKHLRPWGIRTRNPNDRANYLAFYYFLTAVQRLMFNVVFKVSINGWDKTIEVA